MATIQLDGVSFRMPSSNEEKVFFDVSLDWLQRLENAKVYDISLKIGHDLHGKPSAEFKYRGRSLLSFHALSAAEVEITGEFGRRRKMNVGDVFSGALCPALDRLLDEEIERLRVARATLKRLIPVSRKP